MNRRNFFAALIGIPAAAAMPKVSKERTFKTYSITENKLYKYEPIEFKLNGSDLRNILKRS